MKNDISDKELDMFLNGNARIKGKANIDQKDFVEIFSNAIIMARNDIMNQDAYDKNIIQNYNE